LIISLGVRDPYNSSGTSGVAASFEGSIGRAGPPLCWLPLVCQRRPGRGGVFLILWLGSRQHVITITSNGGKPLNFEVEGMGEEQIEDFLFKVQEAKSNRINTLYKMPG